MIQLGTLCLSLACRIQPSPSTYSTAWKLQEAVPSGRAQQTCHTFGAVLGDHWQRKWALAVLGQVSAGAEAEGGGEEKELVW